jgi:hypothetical protein
VNTLELKDIWPATQLNFSFEQPITKTQQDLLREKLSNIPFSGFLRVEVFGRRIIFSTSLSKKHNGETALNNLIKLIQQTAYDIVNTFPAAR